MPAKEGKLARVRGNRQQENRADLGGVLDDEHAGHEDITRTLTGEKVFGNGDVFHPDHSFPRFDLQNTVDQQEGVSVLYGSHNFYDIQCATPFSLIYFSYSCSYSYFNLR